jgi:3-hydroxyacyl-CoA dehydrogenase/enoyl-CoA hydratase/3-hydroxybutyryl-CoA epimerase
MGAGIAQVLASRNVVVQVKDVSPESVARGLKYGYDIFSKRVKRRRMRAEERDIAMARISGGTDYAGFKRAQVVIEAVFEDVELKRKVLKETEAAISETCIFASNTSSLPISEIAQGSSRPERVIGMHFFSPVHKMPLVEVIRTKDTSKESEATIVDLSRKMGKTVIVVNDGPGFFTTRVLSPYMNEAAWVLSDGAKIDDIDSALVDFGFPVGPMTLMDEVGIDVGEKVGKVMMQYLGDRLTPPPNMGQIIADGRKGRKNGRGVYLYDKPGGEKSGPDSSIYELIEWSQREVPASEIADRCWLQMLNETALCIEDGIIEDPVDIDIGTIFGFGFPPFRGGLLRTADSWGLQKVVDRMRTLQDKYGERFKPASLLEDMAKAGRRFHTDP